MCCPPAPPGSAPPMSLCAVWLSRNCSRVFLRELHSSRPRAPQRLGVGGAYAVGRHGDRFQGNRRKAAGAAKGFPKTTKLPQNSKNQKCEECFRARVCFHGNQEVCVRVCVFGGTSFGKVQAQKSRRSFGNKDFSASVPR